MCIFNRAVERSKVDGWHIPQELSCQPQESSDCDESGPVHALQADYQDVSGCGSQVASKLSSQSPLVSTTVRPALWFCMCLLAHLGWGTAAEHLGWWQGGCCHESLLSEVSQLWMIFLVLVSRNTFPTVFSFCPLLACLSITRCLMVFGCLCVSSSE